MTGVMSRIPMLLCTGYRLFAALLLEARAAVDEGDWADVQACLTEFALRSFLSQLFGRLSMHCQAEEEHLYPFMHALNAAVFVTLARTLKGVVTGRAPP